MNTKNLRLLEKATPQYQCCPKYFFQKYLGQHCFKRQNHINLKIFFIFLLKNLVG